MSGRSSEPPALFTSRVSANTRPGQCSGMTPEPDRTRTLRRVRQNGAGGRCESQIKLGYWSYIGLASLSMVIVSLIYGVWSIAALSGALLALATWRYWVEAHSPAQPPRRPRFGVRFRVFVGAAVLAVLLEIGEVRAAVDWGACRTAPAALVVWSRSLP